MQQRRRSAGRRAGRHAKKINPPQCLEDQTLCEVQKSGSTLFHEAPSSDLYCSDPLQGRRGSWLLPDVKGDFADDAVTGGDPFPVYGNDRTTHPAYLQMASMCWAGYVNQFAGGPHG